MPGVIDSLGLLNRALKPSAVTVSAILPAAKRVWNPSAASTSASAVRMAVATRRSPQMDTLPKGDGKELHKRDAIMDPIMLDKEITFASLSVRGHISKELLATFMENNLNRFDVKQIVSIMKLLGRRSKLNSNSDMLTTYLPAIANRIEALPASKWSFDEISEVIYGLQCLSEMDLGVQNVLLAMTNLSHSLLQKTELKHSSTNYRNVGRTLPSDEMNISANTFPIE